MTKWMISQRGKLVDLEKAYVIQKEDYIDHSNTKEKTIKYRVSAYFLVSIGYVDPADNTMQPACEVLAEDYTDENEAIKELIRIEKILKGEPTK